MGVNSTTLIDKISNYHLLSLAKHSTKFKRFVIFLSSTFLSEGGKSDLSKVTKVND